MFAQTQTRTIVNVSLQRDFEEDFKNNVATRSFNKNIFTRHKDHMVHAKVFGSCQHALRKIFANQDPWADFTYGDTDFTYGDTMALCCHMLGQSLKGISEGPPPTDRIG